MELGAASSAPSLLLIRATSWPRSIGVPVALLTPIWTPPRGNLWVTVSVSEPSWYGVSGTCGTWNRRISADRRRHDRGGARVLDHLAKNQLHWFLFSEKNRSGDSRMNSPPNAHMLSTCLWIVFDDSSDAARCSRTGRNSHQLLNYITGGRRLQPTYASARSRPQCILECPFGSNPLSIPRGWPYFSSA